MKAKLILLIAALALTAVGQLVVKKVPLLYDPVYRVNSLGMQLIPIEFKLSETPYTLFMQSTETTRRQWNSIMSLPGSQDIRCPTCPLSEARVKNIVQFIDELNQREGCPLKLEEIVAMHGSKTVEGCYRLPTNKEWTYACLADQKLPFGLSAEEESQILRYSWSSSNAFIRPKPTAQKLPNGFGLYDMLGNVRELSVWHGNLGKKADEVAEVPYRSYDSINGHVRRKKSVKRSHEHFYPFMNGSFQKIPDREFACDFEYLKHATNIDDGFRLVRYPDRISNN